MRVAFLSEGATELAFAPGARVDEAWRHDFLLKIIVERILDAEGRIEPLEDERLPYLVGNPAGRLCRSAAPFVRECTLRGADAAVVVVDRDRGEPRRRLRALIDQRERLRHDPNRPLAVPMAVGVAVETVEAWLLADEMRLCEVLGLSHPDQPMGSPEQLSGKPGEPDHPKSVLNAYFARDADGSREFLDRVVALGRMMDLDVVARRCPQGFAHFRDDVLAELGPHFGRA